MNRSEFMKRLSQLLSDLSPAEREEALQYYEDYFDDAGVENEQQVLADLESPAKVAATIREGLGIKAGAAGRQPRNKYEQVYGGYGNTNNAKNEGEYTETGYHNSYEPKDEVQSRNTATAKKNMSTGIIILLVIAAIFTLPLWGSFGIGVIGILFGIIMFCFALIFSGIIGGAALLISGIAVFVAAVSVAFTQPVAGVCLFGISFLLLGLGLLLLLFGIWLVGKALPAAVRFVVKVCRKPFEKREGGAA